MSAPTVSFAEISQDGTLLTIGFNESVNIIGTDTSVISISNDGQQNNITGANAAGTSLTLNLVNTILASQTVILNYNGTSTYIADNDGYQLEQITDLSATNNSNIIGFVDGNAYTGDFHVMDNGIKMTGIYGTSSSYNCYASSSACNGSTSSISWIWR